MLCLSGCHLPPDNTAPARKYGAASEVAVTRHAQYQLWEQGTYSAALPSRQPGGSLQAHSGRVSFDWEGDALELLSELARLRGQQFSYSGVRLPLPVSLHVRDMTFADALRLTEPRLPGGQSLTVSRAFTSFLYANGRKNEKQVCLLLSGLLLAGCAGQHHRPPAGMAGNLPPPDLRAWLTPH
nr:hypothetical protein pSH12sh288-1_00002 [Shigella sonnei]